MNIDQVMGVIVDSFRENFEIGEIREERKGEHKRVLGLSDDDGEMYFISIEV